MSQAFLWSPSAQKREPVYLGQGHPGQMQLVTGAVLPPAFSSVPFGFAFAFGFPPLLAAFALGFGLHNSEHFHHLKNPVPLDLHLAAQPVPPSC